jgi:hypothetical protein
MFIHILLGVVDNGVLHPQLNGRLYYRYDVVPHRLVGMISLDVVKLGSTLSPVMIEYLGLSSSDPIQSLCLNFPSIFCQVICAMFPARHSSLCLVWCSFNHLIYAVCGTVV